MRKLIFVITFILFHSVMAMAQSNDVSKADVYGGYSYLRTEMGRNNLSGFNTSVTGNLNKNFGVVAEVGGLYQNNSSLYTYMFGPKYSLRTKSNLTPYLHALFGTTSPQPVFAMALGGGLDYRLNDRVSLRLVQVDYLQFRNGNNHTNNARVSFGVVFHLGKK